MSLARIGCRGESKWPDTIEEIYELFLIQIGFLDRTPRGRVATHLAYDHFKVKRPRVDRSGQETLF